MVQWLGLHAVTAKGPGLIPGQGIKILQSKKKKKKKQDPTVCVAQPRKKDTYQIGK